MDQKRKPDNRLAKSMAGTFGLRSAFAGLKFVTNILLARLLSISEFGMYVYGFNWVSVLSMITTVGLENLLVREVALYQKQESWGFLRGILRRSDQIVFCVSSGVGLIAIATAWHTWQSTNWPLFLVFSMAMIGLPPASLRNLRRGAMDGLSRVALGFLPETVIDPLLFILLTLAAAIAFNGVSAPLVMGFYSATTFVSFAIGTKLLRDSRPTASRHAVPKYKMRAWLRSAIPFMFLGSIYVLSARVDILMLGSIKGVEVSGLYMPVSRGAQILTFVPAAVARVLAPKVAQTYAAGNLNEVRRLMTKSARTIFLISCPVVVFAISLSYWYLSLFGQEFQQGSNSFAILCIGQLLGTLFGLSNVLLNMTGYETQSAMIAGTGVCLNIVFNAIWIPTWGLEGAAMATTTSFLFVTIANVWVAKKKLNINPTVFSFHTSTQN